MALTREAAGLARSPWSPRASTPSAPLLPTWPSWSRQRWPIETSLAHLKTTMRMDALPGKIVPGVLKELTVFAIVYNLVRMVMWHSATLPRLSVERISFLEALRWLGAPHTGRPRRALIVNPIRPHRVESRVKKRRPKSFPLMITPRQALRQQLLQQEIRG